MGLFRAIFFILIAALFFYISHQLTRFAEMPFWVNAAILLFLLVIFAMILSLPLYFWMNPAFKHQAWHDRYFFITHLAIGYVNFLIFFVVLRDLIAFFTTYLGPYLSPEFNTVSLYSHTGTEIILILPVVLVILGTLVVRTGPRLVKVSPEFENLPKDLEGLRILHITDLHIGPHVPTRLIQQLLKVAKKHPADLVVYTGDILDDRPARHKSDIDLLKQIPSKYGNFYVSGNHEYYWGGTDILNTFKNLGFKVLVNQSETLKIGEAELQICGVPDPSARTFNLEGPDFHKLAQELRPKAFKLLLSHQPSLADMAAPFGFTLQLSGHTHGGQFFPWNLLIGFFEKYGKGLYNVQGLKLYVNQGTGYWGPGLRLGTYCEVAEITFSSKK